MSLGALDVDEEVRSTGMSPASPEDEGMDLRSVDSAEDALALGQADEGFHLLITAMRLPGMDSDAAIRRLHRIGRHTCYGVSDELRALGIDGRQLVMNPLLNMAPPVRTTRSLGSVG